jgi:PAS domain S-box
VSDRRALALLVLIMTVVAVSVGGVAIGTLSQLEIAKRKTRLSEAAALQASLLQGSAGGVSADPDRLETAAIHRIDHLLGENGRIHVAEMSGTATVYLDTPWLSAPRKAASAIADDVVPVAPMRLALGGQTGTLDYRSDAGQPLLAAFQPVPGTRLGVVAELPLDVLRQPFVDAATSAAIVGVPLIVAGNVLFFLIARPVLRRSRERQTRFRDLVENMCSGVAILGVAADGETFTVTDFNRAAERIQGRDRTQVIGRPISEAMPESRANGLFDVLRRVWRSGNPEHVPATVYSGTPVSGSEVWQELYIYRLATSELVMVAEDVSDRRHAEEALRESEARWRSIIEMHDQAIVIVDQKHEIRFVNRSAQILFAKTSQELIGVPFGYPLVQGEVAEIEILRPHQGIAYTEMRAIPMRWSGEEQFLLFLRDMSAYKRAEGDLRKLFQAIEQSPASVVITDVEGRIEYVNPKFTEATGYTYAEVVGKNPRFLKSGYTPAQDYEDLWQTISSGRVWHGEFYNRRKSGDSFWELVSIAPVRDARGKITHYVAVKEDISERKATEDRLRHSQKMETIGQLTGGLAHDFNNLLAIIIGNLQLLDEKTDLDRETRELIADALWSAERGAQLTHRLLAFARRQRLNPRLADLNDIVSEMTDLLRRTIGERIIIHERLAPRLWKAMVDRSQLESSLLNLVVNSRDAMPSGGTLTIATENAQLPPATSADGEEAPPGDYVLLRVTDSGVGMAREVLERIFEPFFTTKKLGEGSGLGLSMVYGFVRQSGGQIFVDSTQGEGTSVRLYLPRAASEETEESVGRPVAEGWPAGGEVVMVVEDDGRVRKTATTILRKQGYEVVEAPDAASALARIETLPRLDLLFTDVVLPNGRNGVELAEQVLALRPDAQVLFTSGYAMSTLFADSPWDGEVDLLAKPYRRDQLTAKVRDLLDRRQPGMPSDQADTDTQSANGARTDLAPRNAEA